MTIQTPEDFTDEIEAKIEEIRQKLEDGLNACADKLNSLAKWSWLGGIAGVGGIEWAIHKFNEEAPKVWDAWEENIGKLWDEIWDLLGRPLDLRDLAADYQAARAILTAESNAISDQTTVLGLKWEGDAFTAYSKVADNQAAAVAGVAEGLDRGAQAVTDAAQGIIDLWANQIGNVIDTGADIANAVAGLGDAANAVTFEAGPIVQYITALVTGAAKISLEFVHYLAGEGTQSVNTWNSLNAGIDGLPGTDKGDGSGPTPTWPHTNPGLADSVNDPGQWDRD